MAERGNPTDRDASDNEQDVHPYDHDDSEAEERAPQAHGTYEQSDHDHVDFPRDWDDDPRRI